jgi:hypothetical protein
MPYTINKYNGDFAVTVADGTVDTSYAVKLIGKNYAGYGEIQNENFLALLENFANGIEPARKTAGQVWYDSTNKKLKFYDGGKFKTTGGAEISQTEPLGLVEGDFWWKSDTKQLYARNSTGSFTLVGPQAAGTQQTEMVSRTVLDTAPVPNTHSIIEARVNGATAYIISAPNVATFDLDQEVNPISGFTTIHPGLTLAYTTVSDSEDPEYGVTNSSSIRFFGTASSADGLVVDGQRVLASNFVQAGSANFETRVQFSDAGYVVGDNWSLNGLLVDINASVPRFQSQGNTLRIQTKPSGVINTPIKLVGNAILNGSADDGLTYNIGSSTVKFATVYANEFNGIATQANSLSVGGVYRLAAVDSAAVGSPNTIVARDGSGNINANLFQGIATEARYADLAEKYLADSEYAVGTVVSVGGEKEVTACNVGNRAVGVVSANPAYMMNSGLEGGTYIALKGRVPVKVTGSVTKGDQLIAGENGTAITAASSSTTVFAVALESSSDTGVKLVEAIIL